MPKPLVIVESPAKAKTIEGFLGRANVRVIASYGHVRDLPSSAKEVPKSVTDKEVRRLGIDVERHFEPVWVVPDKKKEYVRALKDALKDADELYLATDEDREGEAISWHVLQLLKPPRTMPVKRMVFHEITRAAIEEAIEHGRELDMKLVEAYQGRRVLDRLFGYEMSLVARRRAGGASSAGRVQSVAARLVVERERERMAFRAASYWDVQGTFAAERASADGVTPAAASDATEVAFPATLALLDGRRLASGRDFVPTTGQIADDADVALLDEEGAAALAARFANADFTVDSVETRRADRAAPASVHDVDAPAGSRPQAGLQRGAGDVGGAEALRGGSHHLHAHRRDEPLRRGDQRGPQPDPCALRRRVPPGRGAHVPREGEERPGGARGDPARGRRHACARRPRARARVERRAPSVRPHLDAHGRVPDGGCAGFAASRRCAGATSCRRRRPDRDVPGDGPHHRVPRLPARLRRRRRRSRGRARGPRG